MKRRGFTTIELLIVVTIAAILVVAAMPDQNSADSQRGMNLSLKLESDIAYAQSLSVADPTDLMVLRVDTDANIYWLAKSSAPNTPIAHPMTGQPYLVVAGDSPKDGFQGVMIKGIEFGGDNTLTFDHVGGIDQDTPAKVELVSGDSSFAVELSATTGSSSTRSRNVAEVAASEGDVPPKSR